MASSGDPSASVDDTLRQINAALRSSPGHYSNYSCKAVSWDDAQRGTAPAGLSCWGANITDTRLRARDGRELFTVRGDNWDERLGRASAGGVALVAAGDGGGGSSGLRPVTLRAFLSDPRRFAAYAGLDAESLLERDLDEVVSVRFQTTFLPVGGGGRARLEFATEAYNYGTLDDADPRNLVLLCTTQGVAVQQDGAGSKRLFHHARDANDRSKIHRYWLEAESSGHKVGGAQAETPEEKEDALRRGKATSSAIGIEAMGTRFNALMTIQIPLRQQSSGPAGGAGVSESKIPEFKCLLIGDGGVGKSSFARRVCTDVFENSYIATHGVEVVPLNFYTSRGPIRFSLWDVGGQATLAGSLRDAYYVEARAAILMFDMASKATYENIPGWYSGLTRVCGSDIPVVLCGNKTDIEGSAAKDVAFHRRKNIPYFRLSVRKPNGLEALEAPFLALARELAGDKSLRFVEHPAFCPPEQAVAAADAHGVGAAGAAPMPPPADSDGDGGNACGDPACSGIDRDESGSKAEVRFGKSSAARVSRGSYVDTWKGLGVSEPKRHPSEHITVTIVLYHTCSGGVPTEVDVRSAVDDLEALYRATAANGKLSDETFQFMKSELTGNDMAEIQTKLALQPLQPPKPSAPSWFNVFPDLDSDPDDL